MIGSVIGALISLAVTSTGVNPSAHQGTLLPLPRSATVTVSQQKPPHKKRPESVGVRTSSQSVFVADVSTGSVLFAKDPHRVMPIASLTKLMTAMVFLDMKPDLTKTITFQAQDFDGEGKPVFKTGEIMTYENVLKSMLVGSVNASANAIARTTLGTQRFVEAMNAKAREFGLQSPVYTEPSGIDPQNRANAADIAAIITYASGYPQIRDFDGIQDFTIASGISKDQYKISSTNLLLGTYLNKNPYHIVAAKTGSLAEAGYCMAQVTKNAAGHQIVAVELGSNNHFSRYQDIKALTTWAFETYEW